MRQCSAADFVDRINILRTEFAAKADRGDLFGAMVDGERVWILNGVMLAKITVDQLYFISEDF